MLDKRPQFISRFYCAKSMGVDLQKVGLPLPKISTVQDSEAARLLSRFDQQAFYFKLLPVVTT
jgi:hypothetical protein